MVVKSSARWLKLLIIMSILAIILACSGNVDPGDPRLQPPLSTFGLTFSDFMKKLNAVPRSWTMAPWITQPEDMTLVTEAQLEVKGWSQFVRDAALVIYQVEPNADLTRAESVVSELARTTVSQENHEWMAQVTLPEERQYLAARLELASGKSGPFSNIVYVNQGQPAALEIKTPQPDEVVMSDIVLEGSGEPGLGLVLSLNGETTNLQTQIGRDGLWRIADVPLTIAGFDKKNLTKDLNRNEMLVKAESTAQEAKVVVRRIEPVRLLWPFGSGDTGKGETYLPDLKMAQVSAFFNNDWHKFSYHSEHPALDITTGKGEPIHSVSDGTVVGFGSAGYGNYLIVDSGGWGVLYLHIVENYQQIDKNKAEDKDKLDFQIGQAVKAGQVIATEGGSGGFPVHLHIGVCVWKPNVNRGNISTFTYNTCINLNPPISYKEYFKEMNIDLYHLWGGSDFCHPDGCWSNLDWKQVRLEQEKPTEKYIQGCINEHSVWTGGYSASPYTTRRIYCLSDPTLCPCE